MDLELKVKKVFISGSTSGIGFAAAKKFLEEGACVIINGRTSSSVKTAVKRLVQISSEYNITGIAADFGKKINRFSFKQITKSRYFDQQCRSVFF